MARAALLVTSGQKVLVISKSGHNTVRGDEVTPISPIDDPKVTNFGVFHEFS